MSAPLRVALDVSAIPAQLTGAGIYVRALAGALGRRDDVELTLISRRSDGARWTDLGVVTVLPLAPDALGARLVFGELALGRALRRLAPQLLHAPHYSMPRRAPLPVVVTIHDLTLVEHPEWHERHKVAYFGHALSYSTKHAARIICVSEQTAERLAARYSPSVAVDVIPHGVDHQRFRPEEPVPGADAAARAATGVSGRYLLFLGTLEPRKDVQLLVEAFDLLAASDEELTLVLAGKRGWHNDALDKAIADAKSRSRIRELGYVADELAAALLRGAAAVAYPSREEGFGLPALEALACGAPLVTSAGSAMADLAGPAAFIVAERGAGPLAEALVAAIAAAEERRQIGIARAATFTWEASAAAHVAAYRAALH